MAVGQYRFSNSVCHRRPVGCSIWRFIEIRSNFRNVNQFILVALLRTKDQCWFTMDLNCPEPPLCEALLDYFESCSAFQKALFESCAADLFKA